MCRILSTVISYHTISIDMKNQASPPGFLVFIAGECRRKRMILAVFAGFASMACAGSLDGKQGFKRASFHYVYPTSLKSAVRQDIKVAILPIIDARLPREGTARAHRYSYRGKSYGFTNLSGLERGIGHQLSGVLAKHLHGASIFSQIILVENADQAMEADLLLSAKVDRARGYVEQAAKNTQTATTAIQGLQVMAEFVLSDVKLVKPRKPETSIFKSDFGWSIFEKRTLEEPKEAAWVVLGDAIRNTMNQLAFALRESDLSGEIEVLKEVHFESEAKVESGFGELSVRAPPSWSVQTATASFSSPVGWLGSEAKCTSVVLSAIQTWHFHRVLGPYRPSVTLWHCPSSTHLDYNFRAEQSAEYLGRNVSGAHYFIFALGETNWKTCREDVRAHLRIIPPTQKYVFKLRPSKSNDEGS